MWAPSQEIATFFLYRASQRDPARLSPQISENSAMKARLSLPSAAVKSITSVNCRQKCTAVHCKVSRTEIEKSIIRQPPIGEKDDYVKTPGSPAAAEEGGEEVGGERWESGERSEVQARSTLTSTAPKARSREKLRPWMKCRGFR